MAIEAEAADNTLVGDAAVYPCGTCNGGARVIYISVISQVIIRTNLSVAGTRTVTVVYESDGPRLLKVSANGQEIGERWVTGPGWTSPQTTTFTATLPAGAVQIAFYNDEGPAPDFDKLLIT